LKAIYEIWGRGQDEIGHYARYDHRSEECYRDYECEEPVS
jgi:hypothetical protein